MSTMEELLAQAEAAELETAVEEQPYVYSDKYLKRTQYVSDNAPIDIIAKEIQSMDGEISVKGEAISQYVEFRLDRYYDGIDLLGMLFNIHYEKGSYGGENRPVNVRYNDTKMILGWAIPNTAVKESGILNMCIWATGNLYDDTYVWKTKPKSYTVNDGLTIAENIAEPDDNWYVQFVNEIEAKIQAFSGRVDDIEQIEENLSTDIQAINEKYDSIMTSAENAEQSAASARTSEQNAQLYKEQTQQIAEQVKEEVTKVYKYQGSVPTYDDLPTENVSNGDVYNVESDGMNYAWDEANQKWDSLGIIIELSKYSTTEQIELMLNQYVQKESGKGLFSGSYNDLSDKPNVNGIELSGNKTLDELGIASKTAFESLSENVSTNADGITNLNSNLDGLGYGENGAYNLLEISKDNLIYEEYYGNYKLTDDGFITTAKCMIGFIVKVEPNTKYFYSAIGNNCATTNWRIREYSSKPTSWNNSSFIVQSVNGGEPNGISTVFTTSENTKYILAGKYETNVNAVISKMQITKSDVATPYKPYIPSVKMLAEENAQQSIEAMDLKMLGWTVPKECPIQNYVDSDGVFHQRVGRLDLGSLVWVFYNEKRCIFTSSSIANIKSLEDLTIVPNLYVKGYTTVSSETMWTNKMISMSRPTLIVICDTNYTTVEAFKNAMQGVYIYYELATPITTNIDGNEVTERINNEIDVLKNDLGGLSFSVSGTTLSITDGTNTWTLSN